ncbi:MAG: DHHW family protein, partial [Clostridium sp.]
MKQKLTKNMTVIIFVAMIFILSIINLIKTDRVFSESENRFLASKPKFTWESLFNKTYTSDVEKYITDQFIWRDIFVGMKTQTEYLLGKKDTNGVYFSKDNYLIEKHDTTSIDQDLLNRNIERLYDFIEATSNKLGNNNVSLMLVPTSSNILRDKLPNYATAFDEDKILNSIKENLHSGRFIDVRPLLNKSSDEYIYYKTDHHWTTLGAYYGYLAWC